MPFEAIERGVIFGDKCHTKAMALLCIFRKHNPVGYTLYSTSIVVPRKEDCAMKALESFFGNIPSVNQGHLQSIQSSSSDVYGTTWPRI